MCQFPFVYRWFDSPCWYLYNIYKVRYCTSFFRSPLDLFLCVCLALIFFLNASY
jgi:hypothetical protein